jgi:hypothetical protein
MATSRTFAYVKECFEIHLKKTGEDVNSLPCVCDFYLCVDYGFLLCGALTLKMEAVDFTETLAPN